MPSEYDSFARHYDTLMGDRDECVADVRKMLRKYAPRAKTILELGCGTGSVLKQLARRYEVAGIDLSEGMLAVARRKLPGVWLKHQNIAKLAVDKKFDVILCLFDTMNHLPRFADWQEVFRRAHRALHPGGIFIFDINTVHGLRQYASRPAFAEFHREGICLFEATDTGRNKFRLDLRLLKKGKGGAYRMYRTSIPELAVPTGQVTRAVSSFFHEVTLWDVERKRPSAESEELYFICRKS